MARFSTLSLALALLVSLASLLPLAHAAPQRRLQQLHASGEAAQRDDSSSMYESLRAPMQYILTVYGVNDTSCTGPLIGAKVFEQSTCVTTPDVARPYFNSLRLADVSLSTGNYTLQLYHQSPLCDDFVGLLLRGQLGNSSRECQTTPWMQLTLSLATPQQRPHSRSRQAPPDEGQRIALW